MSSTLPEPTTLPTNLTREQRLELYRHLRLTRSLEERLATLYRQGRTVGSQYSSLGQEATAVGAAYALGPDDYIGVLIRDMGALLVRGYRPRDVFRQHLARADGPTGGKDCNLHFGDHQHRVISAIAMLGRMIPVMAGVALAGRQQGRNLVALTFIGDGGSSTGDFHEGLNMAAVMKLPLVVIAENNQWAYSTPTHRQMACRAIVDRAVGYGMPGEQVDGNDVAAVHEVTCSAVARARSGGGPTLIEAMTYRRNGHAEHDPQQYVPPEQIAYWAARDPLDRWRHRLISTDDATATELDAVDAEIQREIDIDWALAEASPPATGGTLLEGVYEDDDIVPRSSRTRFGENES